MTVLGESYLVSIKAAVLTQHSFSCLDVFDDCHHTLFESFCQKQTSLSIHLSCQKPNTFIKDEIQYDCFVAMKATLSFFKFPIINLDILFGYFFSYGHFCSSGLLDMFQSCSQMHLSLSLSTLICPLTISSSVLHQRMKYTDLKMSLKTQKLAF